MNDDQVPQETDVMMKICMWKCIRVHPWDQRLCRQIRSKPHCSVERPVFGAMPN